MRADVCLGDVLQRVRELPIAVAERLRLAQELRIESGEAVRGSLDDAALVLDELGELVEEPRIDAGVLVDLRHRDRHQHRGADPIDTILARSREV